MRGGNDRPAFAFPAIHLAETLKWVKPTSRTPGKCPLCPVSSTGSRRNTSQHINPFLVYSTKRNNEIALHVRDGYLFLMPRNPVQAPGKARPIDKAEPRFAYRQSNKLWLKSSALVPRRKLGSSVPA
jgi:hypothetical protein